MSRKWYNSTNKEQYRFHYRRKASQDRLKNLNIKLPVTAQDLTDWQFMEITLSLYLIVPLYNLPLIACQEMIALNFLQQQTSICSTKTERI